jgi:DNA polymerase III alpha subunit
MPEIPVSSKRPRLVESVPAPARLGPRYAELHAKTNFSFLEGASHADELALRAAELGYAALAVTDRNSLAGIVRAHAAAGQLGLKLIVGAEIHLLDAPPVVLWTTDRASYGRLARLITRGRRQAPKGEFRLSFDELAEHSAGLLAGVLGCEWHTSPKRQRGEKLDRSLSHPRSRFGLVNSRTASDAQAGCHAHARVSMFRQVPCWVPWANLFARASQSPKNTGNPGAPGLPMPPFLRGVTQH